jgi:15-cis-phytoene synthase
MPDVYADAAQTIRKGSSSFALASRLLPGETRLNVWSLYAWCRYCDDVTDGQQLGHGTRLVGEPVSVDELRFLTLRALDGAPVRPPFDGLAQVAKSTALPRSFVVDHLAGFEMDARGCHCETLADTLSYCYHVAGSVGLMMAWIMGIRDRETLLRACDLGIAFQLTNIARDVNDDAVNGRVYLPEEWLRVSGVEIIRGQSLDRAARQGVVRLVARLLDEADRYYESAWYGIGRLPKRSAWAVATARHVYADIGGEVRRRDARAWDTRAATSRGRKVIRMAQALGEAAWTRAASRWVAAPPRGGLWTPAL